jgi:hypothetical protein
LWDVLRNGQFELFWLGLTLLPKVIDFYLWFYLTFAVSSTMMPSASDRHAWLTFGLALAVLVGLAVLAGAGPWMLANIAPALNSFLYGVAMLFGLSAVIHFLFMVPAAFTHKLLARLTG